MTGKVIRQMLIAQILSALTVSVCLLIDNIVINRFLGMQAIAAYELANPVLLAIGAIASVLAAGVQVASSKSLGTGSQEETNRGYSTSVAIVLAVSLPLTILVLLLRGPLATLLGARGSDELFLHTKDYLAGFVIGAFPTMAALTLIPFLQMAGQSMLLIVAVVSMTVTDIGLDLLNVFVFHGGMFGMGLASAISYYVAVGISLFYFLSKKCVFRFSRSLISMKKAAELFRSGLPGAFTMGSGILLVLAMNHLLILRGGTEAVAAFAVISGILNAANSVSTGCNGVTLSLTGILFSEEDRKGLRDLLKRLLQHAVSAGFLASVLLLLAAPVLVGLFLSEQSTTRDMAVFGLRMTALGLIPSCVINVIKSYYQGTERIPQMAVIAVLESFLLPALFAFLLSGIFGLPGIWFYFVAGQLAAVLCVCLFVFIQIRKGKNPDLPPSFGVPPENALEEHITSSDQALSFSRRAEEFCVRHNGSPAFAGRIALCVEEMAVNIVTHGFRPDQRNYLSVRIQCKEDQWLLRFRDDCRAFDPVHYIPHGSETDGLGIRLVLGIADEVRYTYSLNLNNLTILLKSSS